MDDVISRQAAIDKINERQRKLIYCFGFENDLVKILDIARSIIIAMPSAQPERKRGRWNLIISIPDDMYGRFYCSECGKEGNPYWYFCPNCGSHNGGEQDEAD